MPALFDVGADVVRSLRGGCDLTVGGASEGSRRSGLGVTGLLFALALIPGHARRMVRHFRSLKAWALLGFGLLALASCRTVSFYAQAARGQWEISNKARPIDDLLRNGQPSDRLRRKLELVQELRSFATKDLRLPAAAQYDCYCDLGRKYAVWVVFAAPEFSMEAKTWWYPLIGSLKYRGFFKQKEAEKEAESLRKAGHDVYVGGVEAYSTLGWFKDPILNTFSGRTDEDLAELLFHELTHQRLFFSGDTDFNEAFATAVGQEGARRWLRSKGMTRQLRVYEADLRLERAFIQLILQTRGRLEKLYADHRLSVEQKRTVKTEELDRLRQQSEALKEQFGGSLPVEKWFAKPVNNARLNTLATYYDLMPGFEKLIASEHGDLEGVFRRAGLMKALSSQERKRILLEPAATLSP